jgi:hypothetical protein
METLRAQVYLIRHEDTSQINAVRTALRAFSSWAPMSGTTEETAVFAGVGAVEMFQGVSAQVNLYPDLEMAGDGEYLYDRKPDAVKTLSPYYAELYELSVNAEKVPKEASIVLLIGDKVLSECDRADLNEIANTARDGARVFDVEEIAREGEDGVHGLVTAMAAAAANLPDTDMWNASTYASEGVNMIVFSD